MRTATILALLGSLATTGVQATETMQFATGDWRPFVFAEGEQLQAQLPGYSVEIVDAVMRNMGYLNEYTSEPLMRQKQKTYSGEYAGIVATLQTNIPGLVVPKQPIGEVNLCFYSRPQGRWQYSQPESLARVKLGVVAGYSYGPVDQHIAQYRNSRIYAYSGEEQHRLARLMEQLMAKNVDVIIEDRDAMRYFAMQSGQQSQIKEVGCLEPLPLVIGFTPADSRAQQWADEFDTELDSLRKSGALKQILTRYGVEDWAAKRK